MVCVQLGKRVAHTHLGWHLGATHQRLPNHYLLPSLCLLGHPLTGRDCYHLWPRCGLYPTVLSLGNLRFVVGLLRAELPNEVNSSPLETSRPEFFRVDTLASPSTCIKSCPQAQRQLCAPYGSFVLIY
jgi:hypothetical protein